MHLHWFECKINDWKYGVFIGVRNAADFSAQTPTEPEAHQIRPWPNPNIKKSLILSGRLRWAQMVELNKARMLLPVIFWQWNWFQCVHYGLKATTTLRNSDLTEINTHLRILIYIEKLNLVVNSEVWTSLQTRFWLKYFEKWIVYFFFENSGRPNLVEFLIFLRIGFEVRPA